MIAQRSPTPRRGLGSFFLANLETKTMPQQLLTERQAAQRLSLSPRTLQKWRNAGRGPRYVRLGGSTGRVRYDVAELEVWLVAKTFASTSQEAADAQQAI